MTDGIVKNDELTDDRLGHEEEMSTVESTPKKKPRTSEDFYLFCKYILEHEKYETKREELDDRPDIKTEAPGDRVKQAENIDSAAVELTSDEDSYDLVTCFCQKPFAGRPMIECSICFTWIHLRCAKVKKTEIPDVFICPSCRDRSTSSV